MGTIVNYNLREELEHALYVSLLVRDLSRELGLPEDQVYDLTHAGLMHDIGKLKLANYLYGETRIGSPLQVEEMKYVRLHSQLSYEILKSRNYKPFILEAVRWHHENYDGTGYPDNLKGEEIPFTARIIRVCDVFAALTTDRPYRKRFEEREAVALMIDEVSHFDLQVFLAFERVVHRTGTRYKKKLPIREEEILREYGSV